MSAELLGLNEFNRTAETTAAAIEVRARGVAEATAGRVADRVRARVRRAAQGRLRAAVKVVEEAARRQFVVGFDDATLIASGLPAMVAVWHEFGTKHKEANPAIGDAVSAERQRYMAEMREAIAGPLQEASSR